jgi:uncharacterized protein YhaN
VRLGRLKLRNFRGFGDYELNFAQGLNLLIGANESGKSTIIDALGVVLFVDPGTKARAIRELESWGSTGGMRLELTFEHGESKYELRKDFGSGRAELSGPDIGLVAERAKVSELIGEMVGFGSREAFESVAMVRQGELVAFGGQPGKSRRAELVPMIERKMTSASGRVDAAAVVSALEERIRDLRVGIDRPAVRPGRLRKLMDEERTLAQKIAAVGQEWSKQLARKAAHAGRREEWTAVNDDLNRLVRIVEQQESSIRLSEELEQIRENLLKREATIARIRKLTADLDDAGREKDSVPPGEWEAVKLARSDLEATERLIRQFKEEATVKEGASSSKTGGIAAVLVIAGLVTASIAVFIVGDSTLRLAVGGIAFALLLWSTVQFRHLARILEYEQGLKNHMRERGKRELAFQSALMRIGVPSYAEFARITETQETLWRRAEVSRAQLNEVCDGKDPEEFEETLRTDAVSLGRRRTELEGLVGGPDVPELLLDRAALAKLREERDSKREQETRLRRSIDDDQIRMERDEKGEALPDLEAKRESVLAGISRVEERIRIMQLAAQGLEGALTSTKEEAAEVLAPIISRVLERITGSRYSRVSVSKDLEVSLDNPSLIPGAPENVLESDLSTGTVDQLYLATRYALLEFLSSQDGAPFILDDSLVNCDPERRQRTFELMREISAERQVIACMCEDHGVERPVNLIKLPSISTPSS